MLIKHKFIKFVNKEILKMCLCLVIWWMHLTDIPQSPSKSNKIAQHGAYCKQVGSNIT